jgi:hypothetical protein
MATGDEILGNIDRALWRVNSRSLNNVTPFTYSDGVTYVDVLERIRRSVIDVIDFTNSFGEEQDKVVKRINEVVTNFITEMEKLHNNWDSSVNDKRTELETRLKSFENRVVTALFTGDDGGDTVAAPTIAGGKLKVPSKKWQDKIDSQISEIKSSANALSGDVTSRLTTLKQTVDNNFYNKTESDKRYNPLHRVMYPHSLIIGSSNAESRGWPNGTWERWVTAKGEIPHNYGYSGGGFTSTPDNNFNTQIDRAISDSVGDRARLTGQIYIIDMLNDIRGQKDIRESATTFIKKAVRSFPNAKIYVIPVLYNEHPLNNDWNMAMNCANATNVLKEVLEPYGALVCEGSRSWFHNGKNSRYFPDDAGVHFGTAGYEFAQRQFDNWLEGGSGWVDFGWHDLKNGASFDRVKNDNKLQMFIARKHDTVSIHGIFSVIQLDAFLTMFNVPAWARPYRNMYITAWDNATAFPLIVDNTGALVPAARLSSEKTFAVNATYPIF